MHADQSVCVYVCAFARRGDNDLHARARDPPRSSLGLDLSLYSKEELVFPFPLSFLYARISYVYI